MVFAATPFWECKAALDEEYTTLEEDLSGLGCKVYCL